MGADGCKIVCDSCTSSSRRCPRNLGQPDGHFSGKRIFLFYNLPTELMCGNILAFFPETFPCVSVGSRAHLDAPEHFRCALGPRLIPSMQRKNLRGKEWRRSPARFW